MKRSMFSALVMSVGLSTAAFGQIEGKVTFDGQAPAPKPLAGIMQDANCGKLHKTPVMDPTVMIGKGGELENAVVYLKGDLKGEVPAGEVELDQQGCMYVPHVVSMMVGQKLVAVNSDPFMHNVHSLPSANTMMNKAQVVKGQKDEIPVKKAEEFKVKCDVHPWMSAWVVALPHPYHSVTGPDGIYNIDTKGLKDGDYDVVVWHEKFKECGSGKVSVKGGKGTLDLKVKPKTALAPAADSTVLVSTEAKPSCCTDGSKCGAKMVAEKAAADAQAAAEHAAGKTAIAQK